MCNNERANTVYCYGTDTHHIDGSDSTGSGGGSYPDGGSQHDDSTILAVTAGGTGDRFLVNPDAWRTRTKQ